MKRENQFRVRIRWIYFVATLTSAVALQASISIVARIQGRTGACPSCDWAAANVGNLPDSLAELAAYPVDYRRAAFGALAPDQKAALAREQLQLLIQSKHDWTSREIDLLRRLESVVVPGAYVTGSAEQATARDRAFDAAVRNQLWAHRVALTEIGSLSQADHSLRSIHLRLALRLRGFLTVHATSTEAGRTSGDWDDACQCSETSDWCSGPNPLAPSQDCESAETSCVCQSGCGTLLMYECNGHCRIDEESGEPDEPLPCFEGGPNACAAAMAPTQTSPKGAGL